MFPKVPTVYVLIYFASRSLCCTAIGFAIFLKVNNVPS